MSVRPVNPIGAAWRAITNPDSPRELGDFTAPRRTLIITVIAIGIGIVAAGVAYCLLNLIRFFTNLFYFQRFSTRAVEVSDAHVGLAILIIPVFGGLVVGLMARYGSERIRGHGIPEALEAILTNGSRVQPRVAILKPLSAALAIGTGGPFGAEGPIIVTGGAIGSLVGQLSHFTSSERKTVLVAGAAAGMSATFAAPIASTLLAVELLLFEWKPRSLVPVAFAAASAAAFRGYLLDAGPLFPVAPHSIDFNPPMFAGCLLVGITAGIVCMGLTQGVYACEDLFHRLPIHWMWWPALGGFAIGIGGLIYPRALGVGYPVIGDFLAGDLSLHLILGVLLVKSAIWTISLSSGTSGGVLAPLLMIGCSIGALESHILPDYGPGFWALVAMGAALGGTMRVPLTGVVFTLELTHDVDALAPVLVAVMVAYGISVLILRRSILTEKISRRGLHLGCEYSVDPLENVLVAAIARTTVEPLPADLTVAQLIEVLDQVDQVDLRPIYPIVSADGRLVGVLSRRHLRAMLKTSHEGDQTRRIGEMQGSVVVAYAGESLRAAADRMAATGRTRLPVVDNDRHQRYLGFVALQDVLVARSQALDLDHVRERAIVLRLPRRRSAVPAVPPAATPSASS